MKRISILSMFALLGSLVAGCGAGKTPEETEAAKYPQVAPLSPEDQAKVDAMNKNPMGQSKSQPATGGK
ncbi:hypothetical protein BH11ARM2_BH11ARM2_00660 [soil metagenome]